MNGFGLEAFATFRWRPSQMFSGGLLVAVFARPGRKVWALVKEFVAGCICLRCRRTKGTEDTENTFVGEFRCGVCPRCRAQIRAEISDIKNETEALEYQSTLIRRGEFITRDLLTKLRREMRMEQMQSRR